MSIEESTEPAPRRPRSRSNRLQHKLTGLTLAAALFAFGLKGDETRLIENDLRGTYSIRYEISDTLQPNKWRRVKVVVNSPRLTARTIAGYFTP